MTIENIFSLKDKVTVITGAAGLLGKKHAEAVCAFGGTPFLLDIKEDELHLLSEKLKNKYSTDVHSLGVDITSESEVEMASNEVIKICSKIDGLINNAANNPIPSTNNKDFSRLENFELDHWNKDISVGLTGAFLCSKHFGSKISKNPNGGVIINISSDLGLIAPDQRLYAVGEKDFHEQPVKPVTYSVVKTAMIGLTRYLSTYWSDYGVRCNALCPGGVENGQDPEFIEKVIKKIPMNRLADASEYQGVIVWMLSDASSYLNGAILPVDGGRTAW